MMDLLNCGLLWFAVELDSLVVVHIEYYNITKVFSKFRGKTKKFYIEYI